MYIYEKLSFNEFEQAFERRGRGEQFTRGALRALYEHLEESHEPVELDVIDLCCTYCEEPLADVLMDELQDSTFILWSDDETVLFEAY